jgi:hypothetical protein
MYKKVEPAVFPLDGTTISLFVFSAKGFSSVWHAAAITQSRIAILNSVLFITIFFGMLVFSKITLKTDDMQQSVSKSDQILTNSDICYTIKHVSQHSFII